jgi:hypothetical protein
MRKFESGATRDDDDGKLDYDGFNSPLVMRRFAEYMHKHRIQADGGLRESDNWQKGIPVVQYMKSMWRHFMDVWSIHRMMICHRRRNYLGISLRRYANIQSENLCALKFNVDGMLHEIELLKEATAHGQVVGETFEPLEESH